MTPQPRALRRAIPYHVRMSVYARAAGRCEHCHIPGLRLELHHITYDLMDITHDPDDAGEIIFGHETANVLVALCRDCHFAMHCDPNGDFWADPKEMETAWATYWQEDDTLFRWLPDGRR